MPCDSCALAASRQWSCANDGAVSLQLHPDGLGNVPPRQIDVCVAVRCCDTYLLIKKLAVIRAMHACIYGHQASKHGALHVCGVSRKHPEAARIQSTVSLLAAASLLQPMHATWPAPSKQGLLAAELQLQGHWKLWCCSRLTVNVVAAGEAQALLAVEPSTTYSLSIVWHGMYGPLVISWSVQWHHSIRY